MSLTQSARTPKVYAQCESGDHPLLDDLPELELDATTPTHDFIPPTPTSLSSCYKTNNHSPLFDSPCNSKAPINLPGLGIAYENRNQSGTQPVESSTLNQPFKFILNEYFSACTTTSRTIKLGASATEQSARLSTKVDFHFSDIRATTRQTKEQAHHFDYARYQKPVDSQTRSATLTTHTVDGLAAVGKKDLDNNRKQVSQTSDCLRIEPDSPSYIVNSQLQNPSNALSQHDALFRAAVNKLSSILPSETVARLQQDPKRCIATNATRQHRQCGNHLRWNGRKQQLMHQNSRLGRPYTLTDAVSVIEEIISEFTCRQGTHQRKAESKLQDVLDSLQADLSWYDRHCEQISIPVASTDIEALFQWFTAVTTLNSNGNAQESNTSALDNIPIESPSAHPALNQNDLGNTTHPSERYNLRRRDKGSIKSNNAIAVTPKRQIPTVWPSAETAIGQTFIPYEVQRTRNRTPSQLIRYALLKPLTLINDQKEGYIYMYWIAGNFGYCKIGLTKGIISKRLKEWEKCGHTVASHNLIGSNSDGSPLTIIPHVYRVELLIQAELHRQRRREDPGCRGCNRKHKEWFHVDAEHAKKVVAKWSQWMVARNPYDTKPLTESELESLCQPLQYEAPKADTSRRVSHTRATSHGTEKTSRPLRRSARIAARVALDEKVQKAIRESFQGRQSNEIADVETPDGTAETEESGDEDNEGEVQIDDEFEEEDVLEDTRNLREWSLVDS